MKAQVISMDFIMTFIVFIFALSIFFFSLSDQLSTDESLDLDRSTVFGLLEHSDPDIIDGVIINHLNFTDISTHTQDGAYTELFHDLIFPDYPRVDVCVFLVDSTSNINTVIAASSNPGTDHLVVGEKDAPDDTSCDDADFNSVYQASINCQGDESLSYTKTVLHEGEYKQLKVIICAEK